MRSEYQCPVLRGSRREVEAIRLKSRRVSKCLEKGSKIRTYMSLRRGDFCLLNIFPRTLTYLRGSYTSRIHLLALGYHPHPLLARIAVDVRSKRESHGRDALSIRGSTNPVATEVHHYTPASFNVSVSLSCILRYILAHTPLTRSNINLIATQNSSKSSSPSPSTSARSHTFSSCSSRSRLFLSTEAA